ncbi:solute carrier organic anion transporter family member [Elysia marginata]|uniref:Solute carrier organic anion transporter family member n=1 Tax=Elysia marginata TaxID=1093978 RepID=A0AAV4H3S6_9GAST|nr:solute carrier organic anion transporter family member [Elysia marginata]
MQDWRIKQGFKKCAYVGGQGTVVPGFCQNCNLFPPFMALFTLMAMCMLATITPHTLMTARLVPLKDQPNVTALTSVVFTVGMLVGPIIFGQIYDSTCALWHPFREMCVVPDKVALREVFIGSDIYIRAGGLVLLIIATVLVHCQREKYEHFSTTEENVSHPDLSKKSLGTKNIKGVSHKEDGGAKNGRKLGQNRKTEDVSGMGARHWRKTLAYMTENENKYGTGGIVGVSYGRRLSNPFPDIRRVSFDSPVLQESKLGNLNANNHKELGDVDNESRVSPNLNSFVNGQANPVYQPDKIVASLDSDSVSSKGGDNNAYVPADNVSHNAEDDDGKIDKCNPNSQRDRTSVSEEDIEGMFDVEGF